MIPNVDILNMTLDRHTRTLSLLEHLNRMHIPCPSAKSSAIVVNAYRYAVEHVNVLIRSDLHRHCLGMALAMVTVGAAVHHTMGGSL
jgi:hypothetical protein